MADDANQFVSVTAAHNRLGLSRAKIKQGIEDGSIRAIYPNHWATRVHLGDCERALTTVPPPRPVKAQQAA